MCHLISEQPEKLVIYRDGLSLPVQEKSHVQVVTRLRPGVAQWRNQGGQRAQAPLFLNHPHKHIIRLKTPLN